MLSSKMVHYIGKRVPFGTPPLVSGSTKAKGLAALSGIPDTDPSGCLDLLHFFTIFPNSLSVG